MRKKLPGKVEYAPELVGHFEIIGRVEAMESSKSYKLDRPLVVLNPGTERKRRRRPSVNVENIACVKMYGLDSAPAITLNVPVEIGDGLKLGRLYKIQCTVLEVKENGQS